MSQLDISEDQEALRDRGIVKSHQKHVEIDYLVAKTCVPDF